VLRATGAAAAMALTAGLLRGLHPFVAAPLSVLVYAAALGMVGGPEEVGGLREMIRQRLVRWMPR